MRKKSLFGNFKQYINTSTINRYFYIISAEDMSQIQVTYTMISSTNSSEMWLIWNLNAVHYKLQSTYKRTRSNKTTSTSCFKSYSHWYVFSIFQYIILCLHCFHSFFLSNGISSHYVDECAHSAGAQHQLYKQIHLQKKTP